MDQTASDLSSEDKWETKAIKIQTSFYQMYQGRQWDIYRDDEYELLVTKICYALFGPPDDGTCNVDDDLEQIYKREQREQAAKIKDKILEAWMNSPNKIRNLAVGILFVCCKMEDKEFQIPVFRLRKETADDSKSFVFIDTSLREYDSWSDWLSNNHLPMLKYCYPNRGFYTCDEDGDYKFDNEQKPDLKFGTSPACDLTSRMGRQLDTASAIAGFLCAGIGVIGMFTPLAPIIATGVAVTGMSAAGVGVVRSAQRLYDKRTHSESLADFESVMCYLTIVMSPLHVATSSVNSAIAAGARNGRVFTNTIRTTVTILNCTTFGLDSMVLVIGFVNLLDKYDKSQLQPLDVLNFSISVFFFSHTLIQPKTASGIINQAVKNHFEAYKNNLSDAEAQQAFQKFVNDNSETMRDRARVAKTINKIKDPTSFFKSARSAGSDIKLGGRSGKTVLINKELRVNPNRFNEMMPQNKERIIDATRRFKNNEINARDYNKEISRLWKEERIVFQSQRQDTLTKVAKVYGVADESKLKNVEVGGKKIFADLTDDDVGRMKTVFGDTARNYSKDIIEAAGHLARDVKCFDFKDFCALIELVAVECLGKTKVEVRNILGDLTNDKSQMRRDFVERIYSDCVAADDILRNVPYKFRSNLEAVYHFRKHGKEFGRSLPMKVYLDEVPQDICQAKYLFKENLTQDGSAKVQQYANPDTHTFAVLIDPGEGKPKTIATVFNRQDFFDNWITRKEAAMENLKFVRNLENIPYPDVASFMDVFLQKFLIDIGYVNVEFQILQAGRTETLQNYTGDAQRLELLAEVLAAL